MADAYNSTSTQSGLVLTAYDRVARMALRAEAVLDKLFTVKPANLTSPGSPVTWRFHTDLAAATSALTETSDPDAVSTGTSTVSVTPAEYGNAVILTLKLQGTQYLISYEQDIANLISYNMVNTIEELASTAIEAGGTEEIVDGGAENALTSADEITAASVRKQRAELVSASVRPAVGGLYIAVIHPDVAYDLQTETGDGAWVKPAEYVDAPRIATGEIGTFAGFRFVESPRAPLNADAGSTTTDTYETIFAGAEALAKAVVVPPKMVLGPVTDKFRRFTTLGWYTYSGWGEFRSTAYRRLITASSIGDNS